jgi:hypothetical protein
MSDYHYAAWVVLDLRLLVFVLLISGFVTLGLVVLFFRGRRWHEWVTASISIFFVMTVLAVFIFNRVAAYPVFLIEDIFPFP